MATKKQRTVFILRVLCAAFILVQVYWEVSDRRWRWVILDVVALIVFGWYIGLYRWLRLRHRHRDSN